MRKIVIYISMSLDGYVADKNGGIGFLCGDGSDPNHAGSYPSFIETVDTVILGYTTYHQIVTELSPDEWVYKGKTTYVLTSKSIESTENIIFVNTDINDLLNTLKNTEGKDIWICGGASIVNQTLNMADKYCITVIPTILGDGIPLFTKHQNELALSLVSSTQYNGMVDLVYEKRA